MANKNNNFDTTTIILLGLLVLLLVFSIPLFMNNSKIHNITKDLDIIETFSNCNKQHFGNKKIHEPFAKLKKSPTHPPPRPLPHPPRPPPPHPPTKIKERFVADDTKLELYTMAGCGHCINFKTTWGKIKTHPELGKFAVEIGPSSPEYENLCSKHSIRGFPHIQITKNGMKLTEYKGPRTVIDIYNWFKNTVM
tara:strand:+ start:2206 stop:2787 length:582 start_codon:yes stop_codon:yes gene_type:complete